MLFFPEFLIPGKSNVDIFIHKKETAQNPFWVGLLFVIVGSNSLQSVIRNHLPMHHHILIDYQLFTS